MQKNMSQLSSGNYRWL